MMGKKYTFKYLKPFDKIIVTGPPRAGTTISARIIAKELKYKFIDESWYDGNDSMKFHLLLNLSRKLVIQCTAFLRDLHTFANRKNVMVVLVKRDIGEILASMKHTLDFDKNPNVKFGIVNHFDREEQQRMLDWYEAEEGENAPEAIYRYFYAKNKRFFEMKYDSFKDHPLWIDLRERREHFEHMKQIDYDPLYVSKKMGFMIIEAEDAR